MSGATSSEESRLCHGKLFGNGAQASSLGANPSMPALTKSACTSQTEVDAGEDESDACSRASSGSWHTMPVWSDITTFSQARSHPYGK